MHLIAVAAVQRLFDDAATYPLELLSSKALKSGVLHLRYAPTS